MKLGEKILEYRKKLGLSQEALGEKIGVSRQTVSKWEIGQTIPELEKMILLAKEFQTTIDELVQDEENQVQEENQDINQGKIKNNFLIKLHSPKMQKALMMILLIVIIIFICFVGKVIYRITLLNGFEKQIMGFRSYYYEEIKEPYEENYRLEISTFNTERGVSGAADEIIAFYVKGSKCVKKTMINGEQYNPIKIEHLDFDTGEYYDIDNINKKYKKDDLRKLNFKKNLELTNQMDYLINDILGNIKIEGWKNKIKFAFDFDKKINIRIGGGYSINYISDKNIWRSVGVSSKNIFYLINTVDENNASCSSQIYYNLDKDVVVAESLTALPDLSKYTLVE